MGPPTDASLVGSTQRDDVQVDSADAKGDGENVDLRNEIDV